MLSKQEVFDKVAAHLLKQGEKSLDKDGECAYRGEGGRMCAIGALIPDSRYNQDLEGLSVDSVEVERLLSETVQLDCEEMLSALQDVHDNCSVDQWRNGLYLVAGDHDLNTRVLDATNIGPQATDQS